MGKNKVIIASTPNDGSQTWLIPAAQALGSDYRNPGTYVKIELLKNGVVNRIILSSTPNDKSQNWTIPSTQAPGVDYRIRITSTTNAAYNDTGNRNFTIGI